MIEPIRITLIPKRLAWCDDLALQRQNQSVTAGRVPGSGAPTDDAEALELNRRGVYGEAAGMLYLLPMKWHLIQEGRNSGLPDYDDWVDMKTNKQRYPTNFLIVREPNPPQWAYVLCFPDPHPTYCLFGWCYGYEAKVDAYKGDLSGRGRPPAYNVPHTAPIIKPMHELRRLMALRNQTARPGV